MRSIAVVFGSVTLRGSPVFRLASLGIPVVGCQDKQVQSINGIPQFGSSQGIGIDDAVIFMLSMLS